MRKLSEGNNAEKIERRVSSSRVALYLPDLRGGGAERVMVQLATSFLELGLSVDLALVEAAGPYLSELPPGIRIFDLGAANAYTSLPGLVRYLRAEKPESLISSLDLTNLIAILSQKASRIPIKVIVQIVSTVSLQERSPIKKKLERILLAYIYPQAYKIIAVSKGVAHDLARYTGIHPQRIQTIYNPIITPGLIKKSQEPVQHPWFKEEKIPIILSAGRLTKVKDYSTLLHAFAFVRQSHPARLVILGEGEERDNLQHLASTLGVASDFDMPGFCQNPYAYMSKVNVFVLSSIREGLPNVLIEAMACGCPIVSADCQSGPAEILAEGKYGHLVTVGDAQAMADAIVRVLAGETCLPPADWLEQFERARVVNQYLEIMGIEIQPSFPLHNNQPDKLYQTN